LPSDLFAIRFSMRRSSNWYPPETQKKLMNWSNVGGRSLTNVLAWMKRQFFLLMIKQADSRMCVLRPSLFLVKSQLSLLLHVCLSRWSFPLLT
jgi:hypothetical protein